MPRTESRSLDKENALLVDTTSTNRVTGSAVAANVQGRVSSTRPWLRLSGSLSGFGFLGLLIGITVTALDVPKPDESATSTLAWYVDHRGTALAVVLLSSLTAGVFLWFVGHLRDHLARASTAGGPAGVVAISGTAIAVTAATGTASNYVLTMMANRPGVTPDPSLVRMVNDLSSVWFGFLSIFAGVFALALSVAFLERAVTPRSAGWLALLTGTVAVIAGSLFFFPNTQGKPMGATVLAVVGFVGFLAVVLITSIDVARTERSRMAGERLSAI